jgi:hypothetical protein
LLSLKMSEVVRWCMWSAYARNVRWRHFFYWTGLR